jgi:hypothetical protein
MVIIEKGVGVYCFLNQNPNTGDYDGKYHPHELKITDSPDDTVFVLQVAFDGYAYTATCFPRGTVRQLPNFTWNDGQSGKLYLNMSSLGLGGKELSVDFFRKTYPGGFRGVDAEWAFYGFRKGLTYAVHFIVAPVAQWRFIDGHWVVPFFMSNCEDDEVFGYLIEKGVGQWVPKIKQEAVEGRAGVPAYESWEEVSAGDTTYNPYCDWDMVPWSNPVFLGLARGDRVKEVAGGNGAKKIAERWDATYINWPVGNVGLCLTQGSWSNCPPDNCLAPFTKQAANWKWTDNSHRCVDIGNNRIVFAYCCPSQSKSLVLGIAQYRLTNGALRVLFQKEFANGEDDSLGNNLADCSRIISMEAKAGHLWITFMSAENTTYYYFHVRTKDLEAALFR